MSLVACLAGAAWLLCSAPQRRWCIECTFGDGEVVFSHQERRCIVNMSPAL